MSDFAEETKNMSSVEILNYYRNLYHAEPNTTEQGIVAWAINDILPKYVSEQEIKVGDEITVVGNGIKGYVIAASKEYEDCYVVLITNYKDLRTERYVKTNIRKTGKHIDISNVLEQMKAGGIDG